MKPDRSYFINRVLPGGYQVRHFVGAGAFAYVYYGTMGNNFPVAIKIQYNSAEDARKRFVREIKVLKQLPPNQFCIQYYGDGVTPEGYPFLAMEYVDGATLKESLKHKPLWSVVEGCQFMVQLCDAFGGLHQLGLAHRDVKPDNIMLTRDWQVKLMDLGLVKDAQGLLKLFESEDIVSGRDFAENLDKGVLAGTPEYMAPEQFSDPSVEDESLAKTDTWTDVYSLGLIAFEMLAGQKLFPFVPNTSSQADYARSLLDYLKLRTSQGEHELRRPHTVPDPLWTILARALRFDPKLRQRNAPELGQDLRRYLATGQGITVQDEDKTSSIDLNKFMMLQERPPTGRPKTLPLQAPPPQPPQQARTAPPPPQQQPQAAHGYPPPQPAYPNQQPSAQAPGPNPQRGGFAEQSTVPIDVQQMRQRLYAHTVPGAQPVAPQPGAVQGYSTGPYDAEVKPPNNTVLWIILVVLLLAGAGTVVAYVVLH